MARVPATGPPLVRAQGLRRTYRVGPAEVRALDGVDLEVRRGEVVAVVGPSGSGKSTLLHLLGGLDTPDAGSIEVEGARIETLRARELALFRRRTVGFVFQAFHLVPSMTAEENVRVALTFQGTYGARATALAREALARVGLAERRTHRPGQLSGGEQQRVALARALVHGPPLLLADEPTGNLDRDSSREVLRRLGEAVAAGTTVVLVTHDEELARGAGARTVRLRDGKVVRA
jgi:putative ABC transport system ATP-binding protein